MKMYVAAIALLFSALTISGSLGAKQKECPECYEKCTANSDFVCNDSATFVYSQNNPCSYTCTCDSISKYYTEKDGTKCGNDYICYQGNCQLKVKGADCSSYGDCYIAIGYSYQPCTYQCVNIKGCAIYSENIKDGTTCYSESCCTPGICNYGTCLTKGGCENCNRHYYPIRK